MSNKNYRVIVVDDDPEILMLTKAYVRSILGAEVLTFQTPQQAFDHIKEVNGEVSLLITDMKMHGKSLAGYHLMRDVTLEWQELPVIVMSGDFMPGVRDEVMSGGAFAAIDKPFSRATLKEKMEAALGLVPKT